MNQDQQLTQRRNTLKAILPHLQSGASFLPFGNDTLINPQGCEAQDRILIMRASPYRDVDQSLTHLVLYDQIRRVLPNAMVDFAFAAPRPDRKLLAEAGLPWPLGIQTLLGAGDFDLVLLTLSYVLECRSRPGKLSSCRGPAVFPCLPCRSQPCWVPKSL